MKFLYRWLIATLAGAATIFVWGGISHMVLLKGIGFTSMANEERIVSTFRTSLPGDGLYFFPSIDLRGHPTEEEKAAWEARFRAGPAGMVIYHAAGDAPVSPRKLSVQFLSDVLASGIASYEVKAARKLDNRGSKQKRSLALGLMGRFMKRANEDFSTAGRIQWNQLLAVAPTQRTITNRNS